MTELIDHEVKLRLKGSEWISIRHLAEEDDRSMSSYIRRLVVMHLHEVSAAKAESDRAAAGHDAPTVGGAHG